MTVTITKPTVGGSENTWGLTINTALDTVVNHLNSATFSALDGAASNTSLHLVRDLKSDQAEASIG